MICKNCRKEIVQIDNKYYPWITGGDEGQRGWGYCENALAQRTVTSKGTRHEPETKEDTITRLLNKIDNENAL